MRIPQHFGTLSQGPQGYWLNAASPKDPFFSLRSPHFKEGQWRSKGPARPFRVTTRIGWEHSSPRAAPRFSQPWPAPSATLLLGGPMLVTLDACSPSSPHRISPDRSSVPCSQEPEEHSQPLGALPAAPGTRLNPFNPCFQEHQLPFHSREKAALSSPPCYNPIKALLADGPLARGASTAGTHTALVPAPLPGKPSRNLLSADTKQQCPAAPPLTGD